MRPIKLVLEGFLSYGRRQEIDFRRLLTSGIFLIQGDTGSGKSSIIDGIIFALFGRIPRFNKETKKDLFINYSSAKCIVDFEFLIKKAGGKNKIYRIIRSLYRTGAGDIEIREKWEDEKDYTERYKVNPKFSGDVISKDIIGLSYETFTRTIVLPQGKFSEFLLSTPSEKSSIILTLSGIDEIYVYIKGNVSKILREMQEEERRLLHKLDELKGIPLIGDKEKELITLDTRMKEISAKLSKLDDEILSLDKILGEMKEILSKIKERDEKKREIEEYRKLLEERLSQKKRLEEEVIELSKRLKLCCDERDSLANLDGKVKELSSIPIELMQKDMLELQQRKSELQRKREVLKEKSHQLEHFKKKLAEITDAKGKLPELIKIKEIKGYIDRLQALRYQEELVASDIRKLNERQKEIKKRIQDLRADVNKLKDEAFRITQRIAELEIEYKKEKIKAYVFEIRKDLKEGDSCPVCGNLYMSNYFTEETSFLSLIEKEMGELAKKERELQLKIESLMAETRSKEEELNSILSEISSKKEMSEQLRKEMSVLMDALHSGVELIDENLVWELPTNILAELNKIEEKYIAYEKEISDLNSKISALENMISELSSDVSVLEDKVKKLEESVSSYPDLFRKAKELCNDIFAFMKKFGVEYQDQIEIFRPYIVDKYNDILQSTEKTIRNLEADLSRKNLELEKVSDQIEFYKDQILKTETKISELGDMISAGMNFLGVLSEQELFLKQEDIEKQKSQIESDKKQIQSELFALSEKKGTIRREIDEIRQKLEEREKAENFLQEIRKEYAIVDRINSDFSGAKDSFKNYLASFFTKRIVDLGGKILADLSSSRYSFRFSSDGNIKIFDSFYSRERAPESLSGGELFISSLSLALALSLSISGNSKFECFFIDEGFGSLDQDSLDIVISALEKVASAGVNLGIISHVENMKKTEHFAKLKVIKDKRTGYSEISYAYL